MGNDFNGHTYYGELISAYDAIERHEDEGLYPIECNGPQGPEGLELVERLNEFDSIDVYIDIEENADGGDTIFLVFNEPLQEEIFSVMQTIFKSRPDEFDFNEEGDTLRIWWD